MHGDAQWDEMVTVGEFIMKEIREDESLLFSDEVCAMLASQIKFGTLEKWPGATYFVQHQDSGIASWAAGELSSGYELSSAFADNFIFVKTDGDNYKNELIAVFRYLRRKKLDNLIRHYTNLLKHPEADVEEVLEYLNYLNELKSVLAKDIGGVVFSV